MWGLLILVLVIQPVCPQEEDYEVFTPPSTILTTGEADKHMHRFKKTTAAKGDLLKKMRSTFEEDCDYLAHYCLKGYDTAKLCGRTMFFRYFTFKNYCMLDYVNCMERFEFWQVLHMGECFTFEPLADYLLYDYKNDDFLDKTYVIDFH